MCRIEQRNKFSVGETIEIMKPDGRNIEAEVLRILNEEGKEQEKFTRKQSLVEREIPDVYDFCEEKKRNQNRRKYK